MPIHKIEQPKQLIQTLKRKRLQKKCFTILASARLERKIDPFLQNLLIFTKFSTLMPQGSIPRKDLDKWSSRIEQKTRLQKSTIKDIHDKSETLLSIIHVIVKLKSSHDVNTGCCIILLLSQLYLLQILSFSNAAQCELMKDFKACISVLGYGQVESIFKIIDQNPNRSLKSLSTVATLNVNAKFHQTPVSLK